MKQQLLIHAKGSTQPLRKQLYFPEVDYSLQSCFTLYSFDSWEIYWLSEVTVIGFIITDTS